MVNINDLQDSYNRISKYLVTTPILQSENLNKEFNADIYLKNEVEQLTGSFKIRGALSALSKLKEDGIEGVVAFSSGNHAQGVSKAAQIFDMKAIIVMPEDAPLNKLKKLNQMVLKLFYIKDISNHVRKLQNKSRLREGFH